MKRTLTLLLTLAALCMLTHALADDQLCTLDLNQLPPEASTYCSYVCAACQLDEPVPVSISIYDAWENLVYQRDYGSCSGLFRSEDIYLRLTSGATGYRLSAAVGDSVRECLITRRLPRLENNLACTSGYPLALLTSRESRMSITLLDIDQLAKEPLTVPLHSAGVYELGQLTFTAKDGCLMASAILNQGMNAVVNDDVIYVATTSVSAMNLDSGLFTGIQGSLDTMIDLRGATTVAVLVRITVSFDPAGAAIDPRIELDGQRELWMQLMQQTESEAVG